MIKDKFNNYSLLVTGSFTLSNLNTFCSNKKNICGGKCGSGKDLAQQITGDTGEGSGKEEREQKEKEENEKKLQDLNKKIDELLNAQGQLKTENMATAKQMKFDKAKNDKDINDLSQLVSKLIATADQKEKEINDKFSKITEENKKAVNDLNEKHEKLLKENEDLQKKISNNDNKIEEFKKQQENLYKKLETESADNRTKIENDINNLKTQINNLEEQNKKDKEDKEKKDNEVKKALEDFNKKNDEVFGEINNLKKEVSIIKNINKENENIIKNLKNIESNSANIKQIETSEGLKLNFINNKVNIAKTKEGPYSCNSIVYLTEQLGKFNEATKNIDLNTPEGAKKYKSALETYIKSTGENVFKKLDFDSEKVEDNLVLQFDIPVTNIKFGEFLLNYIILKKENALNCLKNYINSSKSIEIYFDDICLKEKFKKKIKPDKPKKNNIYLDDLKDFMTKFNDSPNPSRYTYNEFLFSTLYFDLIEFANDDALKNIDEIVRLEKENDKLHGDIMKLYDLMKTVYDKPLTYEEKDLERDGYMKQVSDKSTKRDENEKEIVKLRGVNEKELILNYLSALLYKLTGKFLTKEQIGEISKHFDDEKYEEWLLTFFITNFRNEIIKEGIYSFIFYNLSAGKFDQFSIVRS